MSRMGPCAYYPKETKCGAVKQVTTTSLEQLCCTWQSLANMRMKHFIFNKKFSTLFTACSLLVRKDTRELEPAWIKSFFQTIKTHSLKGIDDQQLCGRRKRSPTEGRPLWVIS